MRRLFLAILLAIAFSGAANALPRDARVLGGVAVIDLGKAGPDDPAPRAWLGEQAVLVQRAQGHWVAVVGLALDLPTGLHALTVDDGRARTTVNFTVKDKRYPEQRITIKDTGKVNLSPENEARATREIAEIQGYKRQWTPIGDPDTDFIRPADGPLASRFGLRRIFNGEPRAPHVGLDIAVPHGTPIRSVAAGTVLAVDDYFFNGKTVFVDHGNGLITMYCHLDRPDVVAGQTVAKGQAVGLSGATGRASGPHLHWSVVLNGAMVDPELFLKAGKRR